MFDEKLYREANDEIKIDEALIEKTIERAYASKRRRFNPAALYSVAAAIVLVIGVSASLPVLMKKTEPDSSISEMVDKQKKSDSTKQEKAPMAEKETEEISGGENIEQQENLNPDSNSVSGSDSVKSEKITEKASEMKKAAGKPAENKKSVKAEEKQTQKAEKSDAAVQSEGETEAVKVPQAENADCGSSEIVEERKASSAFETAATDKSVQTFSNEAADIQADETDQPKAGASSGGGGASSKMAAAPGVYAADMAASSFISTEEYLKNLRIDINAVIDVPNGFKDITPESQNSENGYFCYANDSENKYIYVYTSKGKPDNSIVWKEEDGYTSAVFGINDVLFTVEAYGMSKAEIEKIIKK